MLGHVPELPSRALSKSGTRIASTATTKARFGALFALVCMFQKIERLSRESRIGLRSHVAPRI